MGARRKLVMTGAAAIALAASGVGVAQAVSGADERQTDGVQGESAEGVVVRAAQVSAGEPAEPGDRQPAGDDADEQVSGPDAERAKRAAVEAAGGGRVVGVEREDEGETAWEVEVVPSGGREVEVDLTRDFERVAVQTDDDAEDDRDTDDDREADDDGTEDDRQQVR